MSDVLMTQMGESIVAADGREIGAVSILDFFNRCMVY
jgi:hypothetical protein